MPVDGDKEGTDVQPGRNTDTSNEPPSQQGATNVNQPDLPKVPSNVNRLPSYGPPAWNTAIFVPSARQFSYGEIVQPRISGRLRKIRKPSGGIKVKPEMNAKVQPNGRLRKNRKTRRKKNVSQPKLNVEARTFVPKRKAAMDAARQIKKTLEDEHTE
jgi:hypothetical protein